MTRPAWFTIAAQEFRDSRLVLLGAALLGWIPVLIPFLRGVAHPEEIRGPIALLGCFMVTAVLGYALGDLALAKPLAERRLGFYFSRPVGGLALWFGKLAGGYALVLAVIAFMLLPTLLAGADWSGAAAGVGSSVDGAIARLIAGGPVLPDGPVLGVLVAALLIAPLGFWLVAHAAGIALRARSGWLGLDFLLLVSTLLACAIPLGRLLDTDAGALTLVAAVIVLALLLAALTVAGAVAIARGRCDLRRAHRTLSTALWLPTLAIAVAAQLGANWALNPGVTDVTEIHLAQPAPRGPWIRLLTSARRRFDLPFSFLYEPTSGRTVPVPSTANYDDVYFAADGGSAAWVVDAPTTRPWQRARGADVWVVDLTAAAPRPRPLQLALADANVRLALSADGGAVAVLHTDRLETYASSDGRLLTRAPISPALARVTWNLAARLLFTADGTLHFYRSLDCEGDKYCDTLAVLRLPADGKPDARTLALPHRDLTIARDGRRILAAAPVDGNLEQVLLLDADGAQLTVVGEPIAPASFAGLPAMRFLDDGRIVTADTAGGDLEALLFTADGALIRRIPLGAHGTGRLGPEVAPGVLLLPAKHADQPAVLVAVDAEPALRAIDGLRSASGWYEPFLTPTARPLAGSTGARLCFEASERALVVLDSATGRTEPVLGRPR